MTRHFRFLAVAVMIPCLSVVCVGQILHPDAFPFHVAVGDRHGFMDENCRLVVPPRFDEAFDFTEGLAAVESEGKWGYIDKSGKFAIPPQFAGAGQFSDGLAGVRFDERTPLWGFIDKTGRKVIEPRVSSPFQFREGLVEFYGEKDSILGVPRGYLDRSGKLTIALHEEGKRLEFVVGFFDGLARVSMAVQHEDGSIGQLMWGYIDHSGKWALPLAFEGAGDFHEGLAPVTEHSIWGFIDKTGNS
jgi:WG containing repeat